MSTLRQVEFRKWPERLHWHYPVQDLGEDTHGRWSCVSAGTILRRGDGRREITTGPSALLYSEETWWSASFNCNREQPCEVYVDIATPAVFDDGIVRLFDLDIDVVRLWDGRVELWDQDEFAENRVAYGYPEELVLGAERAMREVRDLVESRIEPFDTVGDAWLAEAIRRFGTGS